MAYSQSLYAIMKPIMIDFKINKMGIDEQGIRKRKDKETGQEIISKYDHILPQKLWDQNLWSGIRSKAQTYFRQERIKWHDQQDNLLSSQIFCVNIFFILRSKPYLINKFLKQQFYPTLKNVIDIDFEYIGPNNYFNETGGRGYSRTSSDVSIIWEDIDGNKNLLLIEFKFTEREFGGCSKSDNPNPSRCLHFSPSLHKSTCYRSEVNRPYWEMILLPNSPFNQELLQTTQHCVFKYDLYQLMRNQLFAYCLSHDKETGFNAGEFAACYDSRNNQIVKLSHPIEGNETTFKVWRSFLKNPSIFKYFTIQDMLNSIDCNELTDWRYYLYDRYGL